MTLTFDTHTILIAFGLTLFAGLSTGIGSMIAWMCKRTNTRFLSVVLGFSAGVMIYVSMIEIFAESNELLTASLGNPRRHMGDRRRFLRRHTSHRPH